jgi:glycosyltransferase involved in cell wall biosynthesis
MKPLRIYIGPGEVVGALLAQGLKKKGCTVTVVSKKINCYQQGMVYDKIIDFDEKNKILKLLNYIYFFLTSCFNNDVFIFPYGPSSILPYYNIDLPILKFLRKTTIVWFMGCGIRHYSTQKEFFKDVPNEYYICQYCKFKDSCNLDVKKAKIHWFEKYITHIISGKTISQLLMRKYFVVHIPLDVGNIQYNNIPNKIPRVVHAPSDESKKGTEYIVKAVDQLKKEGYVFEFKMFKGISNIEVRNALTESDICVDQLFSMSNGLFANEAMSAGCAVLGGNLTEYSGRPKELPILHTRPDTIYQNLKLLLDHPELRMELGENGRKYVEKYHDPLKVADTILDIIYYGNEQGNMTTEKMNK